MYDHKCINIIDPLIHIYIYKYILYYINIERERGRERYVCVCVKYPQIFLYESMTPDEYYEHQFYGSSSPMRPPEIS